MMYSTAEQVRDLLPNLLKGEEEIGIVDSGTSIELQKPAYDVAMVLKDGTELTKDSDFTFKRPFFITLDSAASGEYYIATCHYAASDTELESLIKQSDRFIDSFFARYQNPAETYLADWSAWLTAALFLRSYGSATKENTEKARSIEKSIQESMTVYRDNSLYNEEKSYPTKTRIFKVN